MERDLKREKIKNQELSLELERVKRENERLHKKRDDAINVDKSCFSIMYMMVYHEILFWPYKIWCPGHEKLNFIKEKWFKQLKYIKIDDLRWFLMDFCENRSVSAQN